MPCHLLLAVVLMGTAAQARAQEQPAQSTALPTEIRYYDADNNQLANEAGAMERRVTTYRDSVSGTVRTYYLPSGKLKSYVPYANLRRRVRHGTSSHYYESGQVRLQETFLAGKWNGDLVTFYPDGTLKRRDHHVPGQPITGECFGADGKPVAYYPYENMPVYPEGNGDKDAVVNAVMRKTLYPPYALRQRVSGVVRIQFVVDKTGVVTKIRPDEITRTAQVAPELNQAYLELQKAAMDAVKQLKPFMPGMQDGMPVSVSYTVPVTFRIQ